MNTRRTVLSAIAGLTAVAVAGCGSEGPGAEGTGSPTQSPGATATQTETEAAAGTPTQTPTATPEPTETPTAATTATPSPAQEAFPDYNWDQLDGASPTTTSTVTMSNFAFEPLVARMPPGTTVTVTNDDSASHTFTVPALGVDQEVSGDGEITVTVEETGTFDYVCRFHGPNMLGRLVVEEGVSLDGAETATPGGKDTETPTATPTETPTPESTPTETPTPTETETPTPTETETPTPTEDDGGY